MPWFEVCRAAALRPHFAARASIHAEDRDAGLEALAALAAGAPDPALSTANARARAGLVFVFPGHGGQWSRMGRQLLEEAPAFADAIESVDAVLAPLTDWSLLPVLRGEPGAPALTRFDVAQCSVFAMGFGLAAVCREMGIVPDAVVGHSLGEMSAAVVAGAIPLADGVRIIWTCARLVAQSRHEAGMTFVNLPAAQVEAELASSPGLFIATVDGPESTVVSGDLAGLVAWEQQLGERGVLHRRVKIEGAPHSPHMTPLLPPFRESMATLIPRATTIPMVSSVTGRLIDGRELSSDYWCLNLSSRVRFDEAVRALLGEGMDTFVELGPHPVLTNPIASTCAAASVEDVATLAALRRNSGGQRSLLRLASELHDRGHEVPWARIVGEPRGSRVRLPSYALPQERPTTATAAAAPAQTARDLACLPLAARIEAIEAVVREQIAAVLGRSEAEHVEASASFDAYGLDSLELLDLKNRVSKRLGLRLPQQFLYDHPTSSQATRALAERCGPVETPPESAKPTPKLAKLLAREASPEARVDLLLARLHEQVCLALGRTNIDQHDSLRELGIDDVVGAELCLRIQRQTGLRVFPREIVERDTLHELATHLAEAYGGGQPPEASVPLAELDARITSPYHPWPAAASEQPSDQQIVFILSPPRSGSTLLRVMLAGHSALFSPQELYLSAFATMRDYDAHLRGTVLNMGLVSAIAEVISRTGAWNLYRQWVREAKPTADIYTFFHERIGDRTLVDKSPLFFPPLAVLRRLARTYPSARFIHLIRHPVSCIGSYVNERFQSIFEETAALDPHDAAEWCWTRVHEGIAEFAAELPSRRLTQVFFEDLAEDPERVMRRLCPALGIEFDPAVLEPYSGHRMVAGGFQVGDPNFTRHARIVAGKSEAWRDVVLPRPLRSPTLELAQRLGYDIEALRAGAGASARRPRAASASPEAAMGGIGLEDDIHLPAEIVPKTAFTATATAPSAVLLTGATGFLGAFLLDELMTQTHATVHCLVRARDHDHARARVRDNLRGYGLWNEAYAERIVPVLGDLGLPDMGLSDPEQAELAAAVDAIYHCAARVSWLLPYSHLRDVNVGGLVHMLRLACRGDTLAVHYVSSLGTAFMRPFEYRDMVEWVTRSGLGTESILELPLGYIESKWVNMKIVAEARARGVPVTLYAPGLIGGHSVSGVDSLSESQFLHALIEGSTQLGGFPDAEGWRFIPVDQAAARIIRCSLHPESNNLDLYLDSTSLIDPGAMVEVLRNHGYAVNQVPFAVWRRQVLALADTHDTSNALFGFTDVVYAFTPLRFMGQRRQMSWFLQNHGVPPAIREILGEQAYVDRELLQRLVDYYVRAGAMPPCSAPDQR